MRVRRGSLSHFLLLVLEKTIDGAVRVDEIVSNPYKYATGPDLFPKFRRSSLSDAVRRLGEAGYIEKGTDQGTAILKLTEMGRDYLGVQEPWDGKYRIVVWDIPESKKKLRNLFRRRLKEWGFKSWQRSVWVSNKNVTSKLRDLISELGLASWVAVIESDDPFLSRVMLNDRST